MTSTESGKISSNAEYTASSALDQEILKELDGKSDERKEQILQIIKIFK